MGVCNMTYEEEIKLSHELWDSLPFDEPEDGMDLWEYMNNMSYKFRNIQLPEEFEGEVFNFVTEYEVGQYIEKRFNVNVQERCSYYIQHKHKYKPNKIVKEV